MKSPIAITERAMIEIKDIFKNKNIPKNYGLRVGIKGAGCGVSYILGFDKKREKDEVYFVNDLKVLIKKAEIMFLIGKKISFYDETDGRGFFFE